jgi:predicted transcriptional regulator
MSRQKGDIMREVLISIKPKWCELIALGKKTVEVRKTKPKLETPFKCYIYCTKPPRGLVHLYDAFGFGNNPVEYGGTVIGEFVCDRIDDFHYDLSKGLYEPREFLWGSCLSLEQVKDYVGGSLGYAWHITDLVVYDKPRELSDFRRPELPTGLRYEDDAITRPPQSWRYIEPRQTAD